MIIIYYEKNLELLNFRKSIRLFGTFLIMVRHFSLHTTQM